VVAVVPTALQGVNTYTENICAAALKRQVCVRESMPSHEVLDAYRDFQWGPAFSAGCT